MSALTMLPREVSKPRPINDYQRLAEAVGAIVPCDELVLLSTMPRGGLQVCRTLHAGEAAARRYASEGHLIDSIAWQAIQHGHTVPSHDGKTQRSALTIGFETTIAVRIDSPVFAGYPGVLVVLHRSDSPMVAGFDAARVAGQIRAAFDSQFRHAATPNAAPRQFVFSAGKSILPNAPISGLDPKLAQSIEHQLPMITAETTSHGAVRFSLPDSTGNCWPVQFVRFESYPALAAGPVVFVSLHPQFHDWEKLEAETFGADAEVSRLAAAVNFMVRHYRRGPTLEEVAGSVHLSQFHFHRRFSEIFGMTPKDLLYDLQLNEAKRLLADPGQQLAEIARHCGFSHQSHFTSRFKQGTGLTPTRWRRVSMGSRA